jgi:CheY-like chemotaxis protein
VLYAEDDVVSAQVMSHLLALLGIETRIAINGADAVSLYAAQRFALVLLDLRMPVLDGLAAAREIRRIETVETRPRIPIVGITADPASSRRAALEAGLDTLLLKPVRFEELRDVVGPLLPADPTN